jgi:hypothetical protein
MVQWTDRHGRAWDLLLTFAVVDRVKAETGQDLSVAMERGGEAMVAVLMGNGRRTLANVLQCASEAQIAERGVGPEEWADLFDGPTLDRATTAVIEAMTGFFLRSRIGQSIRDSLPALMEAMDGETIRRLKLPRSRDGRGDSGGSSPGSAG